jgi:hypothetical protein
MLGIGSLDLGCFLLSRPPWDRDLEVWDQVSQSLFEILRVRLTTWPSVPMCLNGEHNHRKSPSLRWLGAAHVSDFNLTRHLKDFVIQVVFNLLLLLLNGRESVFLSLVLRLGVLLSVCSSILIRI